MRVMVLIEEVATGERRWHDDGEAHEATEFMWSDGNYSCDCNRELFFVRAGNEPIGVYDVDCSDGRYRVWAILREDGYFYNVER